jgi:hypothetical protein
MNVYSPTKHYGRRSKQPSIALVNFPALLTSRHVRSGFVFADSMAYLASKNRTQANVVAHIAMRMFF